MKIILDENISLQLNLDFYGHEVESAKSMGWLGIKNGELIKLILKHKFDVFITLDKNLIYQQNLREINLKILVLRCKSSRNQTVQPVLDKAKEVLKRKIKKGVHEIF